MSQTSREKDEVVPSKKPEGLPPSRRSPAGFRWTICALIFFAMTVNYMDRQLFSLLVPFFENELRLGPTDLALINVSFVVPYGLAMVFVGQAIDRAGVKRGLRATFFLWNVAEIAHSLVSSLWGFMGIRLLLGVGESGMYPVAIKTMTEWFPIKERSFANGVVNAGANCGAILAPLLGVWLAIKFGWRSCFVLTGLGGLIWILFWNRMYRPVNEHPQVSAEEREFIHSDHEEEQPPMKFDRLFAIGPLYGLGIAKALTDAPWWFYLTWMPKFLVDQFHVSPAFMALAIPVIYIVADIGSVAGGWMSSTLIHRGLSVGASRKWAMLACAICVLPVCTVGSLVGHAPILGVASVFWAILFVALAAGAHQGWSCNLFTLVSDTVPKSSVAVAVGAINGFAMVGVSAFQFFVGSYVQLTSSYTAPFIVAGTLYLISLAVIQLWMPQVRQVSPTRPAKLSLVGIGVVVMLAGLGFLQYVLNRPPYASLANYLAIRGGEIHASGPPLVGPDAKVGWMSARWYRWSTGAGKLKTELVKLDTAGRPYVETKGAAAAHYLGPNLSHVEGAPLSSKS